MKNITITVRRQKLELMWLLLSFLIANGLNLRAILIYDAPISQLLTSMFYVLAFTGAIYVAWALIRGVGWIVWYLFLKFNRKSTKYEQQQTRLS